MKNKLLRWLPVAAILGELRGRVEAEGCVVALSSESICLEDLPATSDSDSSTLRPDPEMLSS